MRTVAAAGAAAALLAAAVLPSARAQDDEAPGAACAEAARLAAEDLEAALSEARWCVEMLETARREQTVDAFPDELAGFRGEALQQERAMGMVLLERRYVRGEESFDVSLTTGAAGLGLSALASMAADFAGGGAGVRHRVQRRTVIDTTEEGASGASYLVQLRRGGMLTFESDMLDAPALLAVIERFPIAALDDSLPD